MTSWVIHVLICDFLGDPLAKIYDSLMNCSLSDSNDKRLIHLH